MDVISDPECLPENLPERAANGDFCASGAHVPECTLRSGSQNHHFRPAPTNFGSDTDRQNAALMPLEHAASVTIVVCETCRDETGSDAFPRGGEALAEDTRRAAEGSDVRVRRIACLGNCQRRLSAAIVRSGAWSYVFGDLSVDSGADLVAGAKLFAGSSDGLIPWRGRPESLKRGLVARIPPVELTKEAK